MKNRIKASCFWKFFVFFLLTPLSLLGRDLSGQFGAGIALVDFATPTVISGKYHFSKYTSGSFLVGFDTGTTGNSHIGFKVYKNLNLETHLNFFLGGGLLLISEKVGTIQSSGYELDALFGFEFFLEELPRLGFQAEGGIAIRTPNSLRLKTLGAGFASIAIHYYL